MTSPSMPLQSTHTLSTLRLQLRPLCQDDVALIFALTNSPEWKQFIGDRNINSDQDAAAYIQKILNTSNIQYWAVQLKKTEDYLGIITFMKRDYLEHFDIGFAFLSKFTKKGYAFEATAAVLGHILSTKEHSIILATTVQENNNSIKLLERLGLQFERTIQVGTETLFCFSASVNEIAKQLDIRN